MAIKKWDKNLRPREKAINNGIESLSDYELLALILRCGNKEKDAIELSKEILQKCVQPLYVNRLLPLRLDN